MQLQYETSGRPFAIQPYQYQSTFTPIDLGVVQHGLESRQNRYDAANAAWAETKGKLYDDPTYDKAEKDRVVQAIEGNFENVYKNYNGDLGAATGDLMQMIANTRKNEYFALNKVALEKQKEYEVLKRAYGAKALEFKGMPKGLRNEKGELRSQEEFAPEVVQDLERDQKLAAIIEQSLEQVSREGGMELSKDGKWYVSGKTSGKGYLQGKGQQYDKTKGIYEEYKNTPEGQLHLRMLRELPGFNKEGKDPEVALKEYVDHAIANRIAPPSYEQQQVLNPEYKESLIRGRKGSKGNNQLEGGVTFNSLGRAMIQHPDVADVKDASSLNDAITANPSSPVLNKLHTKLTSSKEYQEEQSRANYNARNVWSFAKSKFKDKININDFPELSKIINDSKSIVNTKQLDRELILLSDVFETGNLDEIQRAKEIEAKYSTFKNMPSSILPGTGLQSVNYASDKLAYDSDRDIRAYTAKTVGFKRSDPAIRAIQDLLKTSVKFDNVVNNLMKKPENQTAKSVAMHMADELNTGADTKQNTINKSFNAALPNYLLSSIDEGLLVNNDGTPANKEAIGKLVGKLEASNMGLAYDDNGNIHFVVTGRNDKGEVKQQVYSFNDKGQNSDVANTMKEQLDYFSGGKISKLRNAKFEPVEGTNYLIDKQVGNRKIQLPKGYKISSVVGESGYTIQKGDKVINYLDYTGAKSDDDKIAVYLANFPDRPLSATTKAGMAKEAEEILKSLPVEFETGDEILDYTNSR